METDTIVAAVTPPGEGGVGMVRISGPGSTSLPRLLFPGVKGPWHSHHLRYGAVIDPESGSTLDEAMGCVMHAPRSYTGEDVFEIHCHGNPLVLERVIRACMALGCRGSRPGEFTLRAFLNGRMDLSQAEAVADVVRARTNAGLDLALEQLGGRLSAHLEPIRSDLIGVLAHMEAMVDFVEDDIPPQLDLDSMRRLNAARHSLEMLLDGAEQGIVLREGATLAIVGSPNVGKSSIMNALLGSDRSIVTPVAGTTRDTVEETLNVRGVPFRTVDTAGITDTTDVVEQIGVERTHRSIESADVVLLVFDQSRGLSTDDHLATSAILQAVEKRGEDGSVPRLVVALNKVDLPATLELNGVLQGLPITSVVQSSTVVPAGLDDLRRALEVAALGGPRHDFVGANVRHQTALRGSLDAISAALDGLDQGVPLDLASLDVRASIASLDAITGASVDDELLDRIFRDFCIGK